MITRRDFARTVGFAVAATSVANSAIASASPAQSHTSFGPLKQVDAGLLNIGYAEDGPADGPPVILLHGWPYDIHSYVDVAPILAAPRLPRASSPTCAATAARTFLSDATVRNGQQAAVAQDVIAFMDALDIPTGGARWVRLGRTLGRRGRRTVARTLPRRWWRSVATSSSTSPPTCSRCHRRRSTAGGTSTTSRPIAGVRGYRAEHPRLQQADLEASRRRTWSFDDATYDRSAAAFANPDHVDIVIHNYRWRLSLAPGEPQYDELERRLAAKPVITVPTITVSQRLRRARQGRHGLPQQFTGRYSHRVLDGIGHNVPQEAPAFADAIVAVDKM